MNKYIIALCIILGFPILMSTTCNREETFWEIDNVSVMFGELFGDNFYSYPQDSIFTTDSLVMEVSILPMHLVNNHQNTNLFINSAYAFSSDYSDPKLNHTISKLTISSNNNYNDIIAGESINDKLIVLDNAYCQQYTNHTSMWKFNDTISVQDYVYKYLVQGTYLYSQGTTVVFKFLEKPSEPIHVFTFDFVDSQGTHFKGTSDTLRWQ